jgi:hypothetical protein
MRDVALRRLESFVQDQGAAVRAEFNRMVRDGAGVEDEVFQALGRVHGAILDAERIAYAERLVRRLARTN